MFPIIRPASGYRFIYAGRVYCPTRRRDVELDVCAGCALATEIQPDLEHPYVRCRPEPIFLGPVQWML
jgi:hypothetical protein